MAENQKKKKSKVGYIVGSIILCVGATVLGKTVVSGLLKCIPGAGSVVGGAISGSVAAALTAALGEAYIGIMTLAVKGELSVADFETAKGKEIISQMFRERLSIKRNSNGLTIE